MTRSPTTRSGGCGPSQLARGVDLFELRGDRVCRNGAFHKVTADRFR